VETLAVADARRLALARAGLVPRRWGGLPDRAAGAGARARTAAHAVVDRFGYLQLDTVSVAGARSHALVLLARLEGMDAALGESLLVPGAPLFEGWGHAACWMPLDLWPHFEFRRRGFRAHPSTREVTGRHRRIVEGILRRAREEGPFRASDLEGERPGGGWWAHSPAKRAAEALWRTGDLAVRERRGFLRVYDLAERVIPEEVRRRSVPEEEALRVLVLRAFEGHGWAEERTVRATWCLRARHPAYRAALRSLEEEGALVRCALEEGRDRRRTGWIRPADLEAAARLRRWRPEEERGVLLTPFDPLLWDRARVRTLFGFEQILEIYVPPARRRFGYFCLPVLAGERLVARVDLRADRAAGLLRVRSLHFERAGPRGRPPAADRAAAAGAVARLAVSLGLRPDRAPGTA
jgi:uncharacterized protein YcaQ